MKSVFIWILFSILNAVAFVSQGTDPAFSVYIDNTQYLSPTVYEFDVMIKASGSTTSFSLRTFQTGIWVNHY